MHQKENEQSTHGPFFWIDHILDHRSSIDNFMKIEFITSIFFDQNAMGFKINNRGKNLKDTNTWSLNKKLLNNKDY